MTTIKNSLSGEIKNSFFLLRIRKNVNSSSPFSSISNVCTIDEVLFVNCDKSAAWVVDCSSVSDDCMIAPFWFKKKVQNRWTGFDIVLINITMYYKQYSKKIMETDTISDQ